MFNFTRLKMQSFVIALSFLSLSTAKVLANSEACKAVYNQELFQLPGSKQDAKVSTSQALRVGNLIQQLSPSERQQLYAILAQQGTARLIQRLKEGKIPDDIKRLLENKPGLETALIDLVEFGDSFPGIFSLANADAVINQVLTSIRQQEILPTVSNPDLLKSQTQAPRLARAIDNTLVNLILRANQEYSGASFGRTGWQNYWSGVARFWSPLYSKVRDLINYSQFNQRQLTRLRMVDSIAIRIGIAEAISLRLNDSEIASLVALVLDSPTEIRDIEQDVESVFKAGFTIGTPVEIGNFNIRQAHARMTKKDTESILASFDRTTIQALQAVNGALNLARARQNQAPRTVKDFDINEIQLLIEARQRDVARLKENYFGWTSQDSNEHYRVEERYTVTRTESNGVDAKGNPQTRTVVETHYRDRQVTPSFENILSGDFDRGDRFVSGLDEIIDRTNAVRDREANDRGVMARAMAVLNNVMENYNTLVLQGESNGDSKNKVLGQIQFMRDELQKTVQQLELYAAFNQQQINRQYSNDSVENFRGRNQALILRMNQMNVHLEVVGEALRRNMAQITPVFDDWDYTTWMSTLRRHRNRAYIIQGTGVATVVGAGVAYGVSPEIQDQVSVFIHSLASDAEQIVSRLRGAP